MQIIITNQNKTERLVRFIISIFLLPAPIIYGYTIFSIIQLVVGCILLFNAISGMCTIYRLFGINTCKINWKGRYLGALPGLILFNSNTTILNFYSLVIDDINETENFIYNKKTKESNLLGFIFVIIVTIISAGYVYWAWTT